MEPKVIIITMAVVAFTASIVLIITDRNKETNERVVSWISSLFGNSDQSRGVAERFYTFVKNILFLFCIAIIVGAFIALG